MKMGVSCYSERGSTLDTGPFVVRLSNHEQRFAG